MAGDPLLEDQGLLPEAPRALRRLARGFFRKRPPDPSQALLGEPSRLLEPAISCQHDRQAGEPPWLEPLCRDRTLDPHGQCNPLPCNCSNATREKGAAGLACVQPG